MKPHETKKTLSLNEARNYIVALIKPMGGAVELINFNLKKINDEKEKCRAYESTFYNQICHDLPQRIILEKEGLKSQREAFIRLLQRHIWELETEKNYMYESAGFFGVFLKSNAMIPCDDSFSEYIDMLINDEKMKGKQIRDDEKIRNLTKEKQAYEEKKKLLIKTMASSSPRKFENSHIKEIYTRKEKLCSLTHNGRMLKDALDGVMFTTQNMYKGRSYLQVNGSDGFWTRFLNRGNPFPW